MSTNKITLNSNIIGQDMQILGHTLHFVESEGDKTIILVHGLGFSLYSMRNIYNNLAAGGYRVIAIDLPGCGYSAAAPKVLLSPDEMAETLHELLKALKIKSASYYAIGEGAIYTMRLCQLYPENVESLVLVSPGSITRHYPAKYRYLTFPIVGEVFIKLMKRKHIDEFLRWIMFDETSINASFQRQTYQPFMQDEAKLGLLNLLRDYQDIRVFADMSFIHCPTLILWGENDIGHPQGMCDLFLKKIEKSSEYIVPNSGHMIHEERPKLVCDIINKFFVQYK